MLKASLMLSKISICTTLKINEKWQLEEDNTLPGKKDPMQHPDVYMKKMARNYKPRFEEVS